MGGSIASHFVGIPGGLLMSVIAFSIVFLVLIGLMLMMMALKVFAGSIDNAQKTKAAAQPAAPSAPAPQSGAPAAAVAVPQDDGELIAVITAAIAAACGQAARVVSFRPAAPAHTGASAWRMPGILQNTEGFAD